MKTKTILEIVTAQLDSIGCGVCPPPVKEMIIAEFETTVIELAKTSINGDTFARAVRNVFAPRKKGTEGQKGGNSQENL